MLGGSIVLAPACRLLAQSKTTNPLDIEIDQSDRVIPLGYGKRQLSAFEIRRIKQEMAQLNRAAKAELKQSNSEEAFELWYRQLKLARAVGTVTEIETLGEVGAIAWKENRSEDLRNIANRLITVESTVESTRETEQPSIQMWQKLATAYQQVRYLEEAIAIYQQILARNQAIADSAAVESNLQTLGELYLAQFNYSEAAVTYQNLLALAQAKPQPDDKIDSYLQTLANIYDRTAQTKLAISTKKRLIKSYTAAEKTAASAQLELEIALDYETLNQVAKSVTAYEQAFTLASTAQQYAIANDALTGLGKLYQRQGEQQQTIDTFERLLDLQRQAYNYYGLVNTYDTLGKIHLESAQKQQAKQYFQEALEIAKDLNYKVEYFNQKIQQSNK
ncbi:MAG: tetratricopeptide repeat protein [Cyanobacteria bacterium P01_C01_bin.72]